jgi:hypothetical protein
MTANHHGGDGNDDREARAVYHEILADAQALFLLVFGGGPPAPADLILEAVEALIADVEHCRALPRSSQAQTELEHAADVVTEQATILAPSPRAPSLIEHREAFRAAVTDIDRLVAELAPERPKPPIMWLWWNIASALRDAMHRPRRMRAPLPPPSGSDGLPAQPPPKLDSDPHGRLPPQPRDRLWQVSCSGCGWAPRTDAIIYVDGASVRRRTDGRGCLRDVVFTVQGTNPPFHAEAYGRTRRGVSPELSCSLEDITPYRSY